ncbi:MAG: sulfatase [Halorhabdus sp.]
MAPERAASNVVLVTIDSLRADALGAYDDDRHTPVMDGIAERGTVFESAFANGNWTPFSFPSMLASRPVFADSDRVGIAGSPSLASVLAESGVATGGFNAANGFLTAQWGYDRGFDEFEPFVANVGSNIYSRYLATHPTVEAWLGLAASPFRRLGSWLRRETDDRPFLDTSRMFDVEHAAGSFIEGAEAPFFLWVHYMDAHTPYVPAPRYIRDVSNDVFGTHRMLHAHVRTGLGREVGERTLADLRTLYQAAVRQIDASVGRLLETLSATGLADETAVVVAGDHGEEFQEHGHLAHYPKLYDELIHVPLLVDVPGAPARRVDRQVGLDAIPPTVTDLLSVDPHPKWEGQSLVPTVRDGESPADEPVVSITVRGEAVTSQPIPRSLDDGDLLVSVRNREWTYIENVDTGATELYHRPSDPTQGDDRSDDPGEEGRQIVERFAGIVDDHASRIREHTAETDESDGGEDTDVDEDLQTRLEALGYR